jgi:hypothetical protein
MYLFSISAAMTWHANKEKAHQRREQKAMSLIFVRGGSHIMGVPLWPGVSSAAGPAAPRSEVLGRTGWAQHKKKIVNSSSPGWARRWKENSGASGERPCAAARGERHRENRSGSHRRTARRTSTCVTATVYGTMCCETDI